jgi:putative methionine-R-sulfoxide reductase with GAF domain
VEGHTRVSALNSHAFWVREWVGVYTVDATRRTLTLEAVAFRPR